MRILENSQGRYYARCQGNRGSTDDVRDVEGCHRRTKEEDHQVDRQRHNIRRLVKAKLDLSRGPFIHGSLLLRICYCEVEISEDIESWN